MARWSLSRNTTVYDPALSMPIGKVKSRACSGEATMRGNRAR